MPGILVVDYGSQYTMLIARRLRELGVFSEVTGHHDDIEARLGAHKGVILSGGPASVLERDAPVCPARLLEGNVPVLGICYGMQAMAAALGAEVRPCQGARGYGAATAEVRSADAGMLAGLAGDGRLDVWMSHGDSLAGAPDGFVVLAAGPSTPVMAMADEARKLYGLQFHPEVTHTASGTEILRRFVHDVCGLDGSWTMPAFIDDATARLREQLGAERVLLGLSGGVDSAVAAALLERAVPGQLICMLVDSGLMRAGEVGQVQQAFAHLGERLVTVEAADAFLSALDGLADPEQKRKAIGATFIEVFEREARKLGRLDWFAQGTIYSDVVESAGAATGASSHIKSHHNVGGLPEDLELKLVEPLRMLFKDEVRALGTELGLDSEMVWRHPFPGPGLAVRVLGPVTPERIEIARRADAVFIDELVAAGLYDTVAQAFAVLLPVGTVGVQGDNRTYENAVALRAVTSEDFMTADWAKLPADLLARCSTRIINEVAGVNRVVYDISSKPPATVEWE